MTLEISAAEARVEVWRQRAGFVFAPIIFIVILLGTLLLVPAK